MATLAPRVVRKLFIVGLLGAVFAPVAAAEPTVLMPRVTYERGVQFTLHGPVAYHVLIGPRPTGLYSLRPVLSNNTILGRETVTSMQRRVSAHATVAGVNGDMFSWADGRPSGMFMQAGVLASPPHSFRSSVGVSDDGTLQVSRVQMFGTWRGLGQRRTLNGLNEPTGPNGVTLYTPAWGPTTPAYPNSVDAIISPLPPATANTDLVGPVADVRRGGNTPIPAGGAVLVARGTAAQRLLEEAPIGLPDVTVRLILKPTWTDVTDAVGGGPVLVRNRKPVFRANEAFATDQLLPRNPRTAVGQLADGRILLFATDGRQPGYSVGMTNFELAQTLVRLGVVTGSALDAGGSTTMAFDGQLLNRPSDPGGERAIADGLFLWYYGVHSPPPAETVVSPNGDGEGERQLLSYKVVRPSTVTATLTGPDGVAFSTETGDKNAGVYQRSWPGSQFLKEGRWRYSVSATDDLGRTSTVERLFWVNKTLGFLRVSPQPLRVTQRGGSLVVTGRLANAAQVEATIETKTGVVVRRLPRRSVPAGALRLVWDGRTGTGRPVHSGTYVVRVVARNAFGPVEVSRPFTARRVGVAPRGGVTRTK